MASKRNPAIGFIFITLVIDVLGIGLIIPIMPTFHIYSLSVSNVITRGWRMQLVTKQ